jgi:hypothetical protein
LTAKLKEYTTAYTARWSGPNEANFDKKYAWKRIQPKDGDPVIGAHITCNGRYIHQRNARDYHQVKGRRSQLTRRRSRDHSSRKERKPIYMQRQHMRHV